MAVAKDPSDWIVSLLERIRHHIESRTYKLSRHSVDQQKKRQFSVPDVLYVLSHGRHEKDKTVFNTKEQSWNYAIRGRTLDGSEARVIVAFDKYMLIITAIRLSKAMGKK